MSSKKGEMKTDTSLGERLFSVREKSNLTLQEFAESVDMVSGGYFSELENGRKTNLSSDLIIKICEIHNICHKWLLTGIGVMTYPTIIQKTNGETEKKKPTEEELRMIGTQIIEILEIITRLKIRIENLESQLEGKQKKNQPRS